jgi:cellulose synthase/poly-beta-1,6-N-acetylglucosamine synthase-like glycosyltransferase
MGDSICFHSEVIHEVDWGNGLTEDFQLRQNLLLKGIYIFYEPCAKGYGEAPLSWKQAKDQRARWLKGTQESSQQYRQILLVKGLKKRDSALIDGALQAFFPSYSTLSLFCVTIFILHILIYPLFSTEIPKNIIGIWGFLSIILFIYPFWGLALLKAPLWSYLVILSGPFFIIWRTWLAILSRFGKKPIHWKRTLHGD